MGSLFSRFSRPKYEMFESLEMVNSNQSDLTTSFNDARGEIVFLRNKLANLEDVTNENMRSLSEDIHHLNTIVKELTNTKPKEI